MNKFSGFPARSRYTPIPNIFFSRLLPEIESANELKTMLHIFQALYLKKGYPRYLSFTELLENVALVSGLDKNGATAEDALRQSLDRCVEREIVIRLTLDNQGNREDIYLLNTVTDRRAAEKIRSGELVPAGLKALSTLSDTAEKEPTPDIFTLYEENIGMLTPIISEELLEAEKLYPEGWIKEAIKEAASLNKRNWRYISRILENWSEEGRGDGTHRGDTETGQDKYSRQRYGHIFKH